jgi:hypothetical protein
MFTEEDGSDTSFHLRFFPFGLLYVSLTTGQRTLCEMGLVVTTWGRRERTEMSFLMDVGLPSRSIVLVRVNQAAECGDI